jgi:hypothetical protein
MITIKTIRRINDSSVKRFREKGETFVVTPARLKEMESAIGDKFKLFFQIVKIEKVKEETKSKQEEVMQPIGLLKTVENMQIDTSQIKIIPDTKKNKPTTTKKTTTKKPKNENND